MPSFKTLVKKLEAIAKQSRKDKGLGSAILKEGVGYLEPFINNLKNHLNQTEGTQRMTLEPLNPQVRPTKSTHRRTKLDRIYVY